MKHAMSKRHASGLSGAAGAFAALMLIETRVFAESTVALRILAAAAVGAFIGWVVDRLLTPKSDD